MEIYALPEGVRARKVDNGNGLSMHCLEAGRSDAPLILLLHGFPELAYSWRKLMVPLASLGFHVVAPLPPFLLFLFLLFEQFHLGIQILAAALLDAAIHKQGSLGGSVD